MNSKRQTVWLVSMLSLMVVLSAYYLFTDNKSDIMTDDSGISDLSQTDAADVITSDPSNPAGQDEVVVNEVHNDQADTITEPSDSKTDAADSAAGSGDSAQSSDPSLSADDAEVLKKLESQGKNGADFFAAEQLKRSENFAQLTESYYNIITDSKQNNETLNKAYDDLYKLEDLEEKLTGLEDELAKDYENAIVNEVQNKFKVVVQSKKLEKSQAVSIVDLVTKELAVTPDRVVVQYIP